LNASSVTNTFKTAEKTDLHQIQSHSLSERLEATDVNKLTSQQAKVLTTTGVASAAWIGIGVGVFALLATIALTLWCLATRRDTRETQCTAPGMEVETDGNEAENSVMDFNSDSFGIFGNMGDDLGLWHEPFAAMESQGLEEMTF
jgi:hypothetical protein